MFKGELCWGVWCFKGFVLRGSGITGVLLGLAEGSCVEEFAI